MLIELKITEIYNSGFSETNFINNIGTKNTTVLLKKKIIDIPGTQVLWLFLTSLYTYKLKEVKVKIN